MAATKNNICYLLPGIGMAPEECKRREAILNGIASSETTVTLEKVADGPQHIQDFVDEYKALPNILEFVKTNQNKYSAIIIGCAGDAGLQGAREQSVIPIIGPGESSLVLGALGDKQFSMITVSRERAATKRNMVRAAGFDVNRLISSHQTGIPVNEMIQDQKRTKTALVKCMKDARVAGANVMLLGCMSIAFMDPSLHRQAEEEAGIRLVNPIVTAVKMAEALIAMEHGRA